MPLKNGKLALAFSGGGVRAAAHLGFVDVLNEAGIEIGAFSGSSAGAVAAALLADGHAPRDILAMFSSLGKRHFMHRGGQGGIFSLNALERLLEANLRHARIEALPTPCIIAATDLHAGKIRYFDEGSVTTLAAASCALVPFFSPLRYGDMRLADGGFMDNLPAAPLHAHGFSVVGVDVNVIFERRTRGIVDTTYRSLSLMMVANVEASKRFCDGYVPVTGCRGIGLFDPTKLGEAFDAGKTAAREWLTKVD